MHVVMADVEAAALNEAVKEVEAQGGQVQGVPTDVSSAEQVDALANAAVASFGAVHLLCNNAGVWGGTRSGHIWEHSLQDWEWTLGVNLWGVVHGIRAFLPLMLEHGEEAHVVNTASLAGLISGRGIYGATKHAVVSLSESLYHDLASIEAKVGVSVLCPGLVDTQIFLARRNRPEELRDRSLSVEEGARLGQREQALSDRLRGLPDVLLPGEVADQVLDAVRDKQFWILPHGQRFDGVLRERFEGILDRRNPGPQIGIG